MTQPRKPEPNTDVFLPGTLWQRLQAISAAALRGGALQPIETKVHESTDRGITFVIRVIASLRNKPVCRDDHNPFLPYEEPLYVANASNSHACVLNKYKVVDFHLLIVTRRFEHQESPLTHADFHALWRCLREYESLGFYNSGKGAGASQKHKHLQIVPLRAMSNPAGVSLRRLLDQANTPVGKIVTLDAFSFRHAFVRWSATEHTDLEKLAANTLVGYQRMMQQVGIELPSSADTLVAAPYNLLVTRRWMLLVPRQCECFGDISLNSLAFAGALLVHNTAQLQRLCEVGPFTALETVTRH